MKSVFVIIPLFFSSILFSQKDQFVKDGKQTVYLDIYWKPTKDSTEALYKRHTHYEQGVNLYPMGSCGGPHWSLQGKTNEGLAISLLDGEYIWKTKKGILSSIHVFDKGEYVSCKEYYKNGQLHQFFDYTKKWKNEEHSWCVTIYNKKGEVKSVYYMKKDENGKWPRTKG